jgi:Predicted redox protein, regulator of disulfide bond formation
MAHMECKTTWLGKNAFKSSIRGHEVLMDTRKESGGDDQGPSPKEMLLASITACSGIDVAQILVKMRLQVDLCEVSAHTETTAGYPSIFKKIEIKFDIKGPEIKVDQAMKAANLSMTKYCGVSAMVNPTSPIVYTVFLNDVKIGEEKAHFEIPEQP